MDRREENRGGIGVRGQGSGAGLVDFYVRRCFEGFCGDEDETKDEQEERKRRRRRRGLTDYVFLSFFLVDIFLADSDCFNSL